MKKPANDNGDFDPFHGAEVVDLPTPPPHQKAG